MMRRISGPPAMVMARPMTFFSSRTLPGRGRRCIAAAIFPDDPLPENQTL
ncbi:MAG: hypothetical protein ABFD62_12105 [Syntrophaceae bacterium]